VKSPEDAVEKVRWYTGRWAIEVYHRTLKSGCKIEERQLGAAERIESCLAVDMVVAWRVHHLTKLGRETPDVPCTVFFEDHEWKGLLTYWARKPVLSGEPPTLSQAIRLTANSVASWTEVRWRTRDQVHLAWSSTTRRHRWSVSVHGTLARPTSPNSSGVQQPGLWVKIRARRGSMSRNSPLSPQPTALPVTEYTVQYNYPDQGNGYC